MKSAFPLAAGVSLMLALTACGGSSNSNNASSSVVASVASSIASSAVAVVSSAPAEEVVSSHSSESSASSSLVSSQSSSSSLSSSSALSSSSISSRAVSSAVLVISSQASSMSSATPASSSEASSSVESSEASSELASSSSDASSEAASSSSAAGTANGWALVWSDEFDSADIDRSKWENEVNCWGGGNGEFQCYTDDPKNSFVDNGILNLVAHREHNCGPATNQEDPNYNPNDVSVCKPYSSARLRTRGMADWKYGRMEIRAKLPFGKGLWPAIWALPSQTVYGAWPHSGEIDILEIFAPGHSDFGPENEVHGTLHYGFSWPWNQYSGAGYTPPANVWEEFHTYSVEWEEGEIRWYLDDHHFATQTSAGWFTYYWGGQQRGYQVGSGAQPFDELFHIVLNVAVGASFLPEPEPSGVFPQAMEVDFVRVYQCANDPLTGKGCATIGDQATEVVGHAPPADVRAEMSLFRDGVETLQLEDKDGAPVTEILTPGFYPDAGTVVSNPAYADGDQTLWDIQFNGAGSAFLTSTNGLHFGDNLHSRVKNLGEMKFDLRVLSIDAGAGLRIKLDSGWPNLSFHEIDVPPTGEWSEVSVRFYTMEGNDGEAWRPTADYTHIVNPFLIEPIRGNAHIQLNNIRIVCLADVNGGCDINPIPEAVNLTETFDVFNDDVDALWDFGLGIWQTAGPHVVTAVVDADEPARGKVVDVQFTSAAQNGIVFFQSTTPYNATALQAGTLSFDINVLDYGSNTGGLVVKADCVNPCSSGDIPIGRVGENGWETITVPVADLVAGGLDLSKIDTPFVLLPLWGQQQGVHLQLDNIRWTLP
ncbi:glycoside hydrolase family 16 protein [Cellvibrio polysaccharolyticus]|uniref:Glycoside hydrolase family 16 protein n=1 Tax=Cellvibrio polysaccharolyticus TaxID=2082724 RepID=A0A928V3Y3_9GAMM|nr:glycoside hydrolase family 16 protein [Cellvibrio polysaccharolyticus]MBE8717832.1 glycoside hydrolase family 16 protein [Cellvibrio polysaccharolyticus]